MTTQHTERDLTVARTIADQLGRLTLRMLGAADLLGDPDSLRFSIKGSKTCNRIKITLDPSDTYTVTFSKYVPVRVNRRTLEITGGTDRTVSEVSGVYVDCLHAVIEQHTGLCARF
jgi:predicted TPR repeat methyltransferase